MEYIYTLENRIKNPHSYMYTPFNGKSFLESYFKNRMSFLEKNSNSKSKTTLSSILNFEMNQNYFSVLEISKKKCEIKSIIKGNFKTTDVLQNIIIELSKEEPNENICYEVLSKLVKKFEVFKKIYTDYNPKFRKNSNNFNDNYVYAYLSFACGLYYFKFKNLKFLNAQLKINDLLISLSIKEIKLREIVSLSLHLETKSINNQKDFQIS